MGLCLYMMLTSKGGSIGSTLACSLRDLSSNPDWGMNKFSSVSAVLVCAHFYATGATSPVCFFFFFFLWVSHLRLDQWRDDLVVG